MNILIASAIPYLPQIYGGVNTNTRELIAEFAARGHRASVLTRLGYCDAFGIRAAIAMKLRRRRVRCDADLGHPVFRARDPWKIVDDIPGHDVALVQDGSFRELASALEQANIPPVGYFHGLEFEDWRRDGRPLTRQDLPPRMRFFANSGFTAGRFERQYGLKPTIVPPVFRRELYETRWEPKTATFINPVPEKGLDIVLEMARRCPDIPFVFVKGWPLKPRQSLQLRKALRRLPNVELRSTVTDMRVIYRQCRVLLVPSMWERETWGRVASEAHCSGIPVLGSDRGGLPEAIGPGGVILPVTAPAEEWAAALRRLWDDKSWFMEKSAAALAYSRRDQLDVRHQVDLLLAGLEEAAATH
ncbi:MAG TPA: glycosyltransferase [Stellaceae bacterium]|nr:glycosyltransferase [Stellaceae bacterium]